MLRRFLVTLIRRSLLILLLVCLGCVAQSAPPDVARKIERQMRSYYNMPPEVKVTVGAITPSTDWPGYDTVAVNIDGGDGKQKDYKFLLSKDRSTLLRVTKFDRRQRPAYTRGQVGQGCGGQFRRLRMSILRRHASHTVSRDL
jgi:hypothetical protein